MKIHCYEVGRLRSNAYLLENEETGEGVLIDCGGEGDRLYFEASSKGIEIKAIFLTHGHADHIEGLRAFCAAALCPVFVHEEDCGYLQNPNWNLSLVICGNPLSLDVLPETVRDGEQIEIAGLLLEVLHTPGHTLGSVCYRVGNHLFTGDTLFRDSIGGEFPPHGDTQLEIFSIRNRLFTLGQDLICHPGHGEQTTLEYEMKNNMYCRMRNGS